MTGLGRRVIPSLLVVDLAATLEFYERLGFRLTGCDAGCRPARWAEVTRDEVVFQFHSDAPHGTPPSPVLSGTLYLHPDSVEALAEEFRAAGVAFAWGPELMDYGMKEFAVQDPNGYYVAFTEPIPPVAGH